MKLRNYSIYGFLSACLLFTACDDDFLDKQRTDALSTDTYWTSAENVETAVNGCYGFFGDEWWTTFLTCATDDSYAWSDWPCDLMYVTDGSATTSLGTFSHFWNYSYQAIAAANNVLDNIDQVDMDAGLKARYAAEARFVRAYAYQHLIGYYGDVPLIRHVQDNPSDYYVSRTSKDSIVDFISEEVDDFADDLPEVYDAADFGRATKGAALALKARTLLYAGRWSEAAAAAKDVMDLEIYSIDPDFNSLFDGLNENSAEIIMSAQYTTTYKNSIATWIGAPSLSGWSEVVPLQALVDAYECTDGKTIDESPLYDPENPFENRDPRLAMTIILPGTVVNGNTIDVTLTKSANALGQNNASYSGYYYKKYVPTEISGSYDGNSTNDIVLFRYPEVLLIYAEAKIESGDIDQSVYDAINEVRGRDGVNMTAVPSGKSQAELREIVRRERRVEFAMEEQRLFDIRRWEIAEDVIPGQIYGIMNDYDQDRSDYGSHVLVGTRVFNADRDYLWPIPQSEMDLNENLVQNPNW